MRAHVDTFQSTERNRRTSDNGPARQPRRADARRNRDRLLDAARSAFAERGVAASLDDVARAANVGIGTLYRHFPTRDDLVAAVVGGESRRLVELSDELLRAEASFAALETWLRALVRHAASYRGLVDSLAMAAHHDTLLGDGCRDLERAGTALFDRAQRDGHVRRDATARDALDLASSIAWVAQRTPTRDIDHLLALALDGLRAPPASPARA